MTSNTMNTATNAALAHALKVTAWIVGSAVIPALLALYQNNATWLALAPVINVLGTALVKYSGIKAEEQANG